LAGSQIISGSGEMLVCSVGYNCSLRVITHMEGYKKSKNKFLAKLINKLQKFFRITKTLVMLLLII
jgi:hypothetical protein